MMGSSLKQLLIMPGLVFVIFTVLVFLMSAVWQRKNSGTVLIDPNGNRIAKKRGFPSIDWAEMELPRPLIIVRDRYTRESVMRETTIATEIRSAEKELIQRLTFIPAHDLSESGLRELWHAVEKHEKNIQNTVYPVGQAAPLPQGATCLIEGYDYCLCQSLGETLLKTFDAILFDFTVSEPRLLHAADQDTSYLQRMRAFDKEPEAEADGAEELKRPFRVRVKAKGEKMLIKTAALSLGLAIGVGVAFPAVLCLISWLGMFMTDNYNAAVPIAYVALGLFLIGFTHRVMVDPRGMRIRLTLYGIIPLWKSQFMAWDEIGDLQIMSDRDSCQLALMSRSGEGKLGYLVLPHENAGKWLIRKIRAFIRG